MKYVFWGTPRFAAIVLEKLLAAGIPPVVVVCNPDRPVGRKQVITAPPVKELMRKYEVRDTKYKNVKILQPENLASYLLPLTSLKPDLFIIAAYAKIIPKEILAIPRLGTIGVHPSLLPKYRGATPIQSAILAGEKETGVTLFLVDEKVDHGSLLASRTYEVRGTRYEQAEGDLARLGGELLVEILPEFVAGKIKPVEQDHAQATVTKKFTSQDGFVEPADLARAQTEGGEIATQIDRKIRALNPEPGVWTNVSSRYSQVLENIGINPARGEKRVKLLETKIVDGKLKLLKIQREGGKPQKLTDK